MKLFILLSIILFTTSCAFHTGTTPPQILQAKKGSKYLDVAVGYSRVTYFLDIGGLGKTALINDAKRRLFSFPLEVGQTFDNLTLDTKTSFIGPFIRRHVILTADVVQKDTISEFIFSDNYLELIGSRFLKTKEYLSVNEKIICFHNRQTYYGRVLSLEDNRPLVYFIDDLGTLNVRKKSWNTIFKLNQTEKLEKAVGFSIGEKVQATVWYGDNGRIAKISGNIIGLNKLYALIETTQSIYPVSIEDLTK